jgi:DNA-binding MurR/RpiR family transcriptional regulator
LSTVCLEAAGDEFDFMKIGTIASQLATDYLLNLLFAGIYAQDYEGNISALQARQGVLTSGLLAEDGSHE